MHSAKIELELIGGSRITAELASAAEVPYIVDMLAEGLRDLGAEVTTVSVVETRVLTDKYERRFKEHEGNEGAYGYSEARETRENEISCSE